MTPRDRERLLIVLATVAINVLTVGALVLYPGSNWRTAVALNLIDNAMVIGYAVWRRDGVMARLILFGLITGFVELAADAWIVDVTHTLDYSVGGGPMLWRSPFWMPFAWEIVAVQFGYIGMLLFESLGAKGLLLAGLLGAMNIPYYEEMARLIHWWTYDRAPVFLGSHTPWAIIIGEFIISVGFAILARSTRRPGLIPTTVSGVLAGVSIFVGNALPYSIIGWRPE
jgi:hypothetical protein